MTAQDVRPVAGPADEGPRDALAHNYHPLPVTVATAEGSWVTDVDGRRYLDFLAGYSALNFGHRHPALVAAATAQLGRATLTSRAFDHDLLHPFAAALAALVGPLTTGGPDSLVLPMNTGAEAVETAVKTARKWGYDVKGVRPGAATIVVGTGNFHGRTTTIVSFSDDDDARRGFDPYTPGFRLVPYGDVDAVAAAIDDTTVAVLLEPVQGESGVVVPPADYWPRLRALTVLRGDSGAMSGVRAPDGGAHPGLTGPPPVDVVYYPPAFSPAAQEVLRERYPDALLATEEDAVVLGLNAVSDGTHVVHAPRAQRFAAALRERGYETLAVDTSELLRGGGGAKCCTLEIREMAAGSAATSGSAS